MSFTFDQLKQAIQDYTQNTETTFVNNLDEMIRAAEQRIFTTCDLEIFRRNQTGTTTNGNQFLNVPADYLASFSLSVLNSSSKEFLLQKDVNFIQEFNPNSSTTGVPRYYARFDADNFILAPTPNGAYTAELHYYYRPASLTAGSGSGTTWLSTNAPKRFSRSS